MLGQLILQNWLPIMIALVILIVVLALLGELRIRIITLEKNYAHMRGNNQNAANLYRIQHEDTLELIANVRENHASLEGSFKASLALRKGVLK